MPMDRKRSASVLLLAVMAGLAACGDSAQISGGSEDSRLVDLPSDHTAHTGVAEGIWPPQPLAMTDVQGYPASARASAEESVIDNALRAVMNNPDTAAALGDNFRQFDGALGDSKSDITASFIFYNYDNNTTVQSRLTKTGSVENDLFPASEWQPSEHRIEVTQAIDLGRDSLLDNGYETAGLVGTAMLAFPPISEVVSADRHYYAERIMYVTFGEGDGAIPVFSALVNLSEGTVTESGLVR